MKSIFISYSKKDRQKARRIANYLKKYGVDVWIDEVCIQIGDPLIGKITEGIDKVDYLIALISKNSITSEWVTKELYFAMNQEIENKRVKVLPVLLDDSSPPVFLKGKLYADVPRIGYKEMINMLLDKCEINPQKDNFSYTKKNININEVHSILTYGSYDEVKGFLEGIDKRDELLLSQYSFFDELEKALFRLGSDELYLYAFTMIGNCSTLVGKSFLVKFLDTDKRDSVLKCAIININKYPHDKKNDTDIQIKILNIISAKLSPDIDALCLDYFESIGPFHTIYHEVFIGLERLYMENQKSYNNFMKLKWISVFTQTIETYSKSGYSESINILLDIWSESLLQNDIYIIRHLVTQMAFSIDRESFSYEQIKKLSILIKQTFTYKNDRLIRDILQICLVIQLFNPEIWKEVIDINTSFLNNFFSYLGMYNLHYVFHDEDIEWLEKIYINNDDKELRDSIYNIIIERFSVASLEAIERLKSENISKDQAEAILLSGVKQPFFNGAVMKAYNMIKNDSLNELGKSLVALYEFHHDIITENELCSLLSNTTDCKCKEDWIIFIIEALKCVINKSNEAKNKVKLQNKIKKYIEEPSKWRKESNYD